MTTFINFPHELLDTFSGYLDSPSKRNFSMASRYTHASILRSTRCVRFFSAGYLAPHTILINIINRYPNLVHIIFGTAKNENESKFRLGDERYFESLATYMEEHSLRTIKKIEFQELTTNQCFNGLFLRALGHEGLEYVKIRTKGGQSNLTGTQIQPLLDKSPNLKTFVYEGFQSKRAVTLTFEKLTKLSKVKLLDWKGDASTIKSLKSCKDLTELVIRYTGFGHDRLEALMSDELIWDLKRLGLSGMLAYGNELEAILKKFPNLEWLKASLSKVSELGIERIGTICSKLKILQLMNNIISDSALSKLTNSLPLLEVISIECGDKITEIGITALAKNCKNLRMLQVSCFNKIDKSGIDTLIEHCKELKAIKFSHGQVDLADIERLVSALTAMRYVELYGINITEMKKCEFYKKHPGLQEAPYTFSVKKLCSPSI